MRALTGCSDAGAAVASILRRRRANGFIAVSTTALFALFCPWLLPGARCQRRRPSFVNRLIAVGGLGFLALRRSSVATRGARVLVASRRSPAISASIRERQLDPRGAGSGDVVIDAAGLFQRRSTTLAEACLSIAAT
jgi:hypothetical protein